MPRLNVYFTTKNYGPGGGRTSGDVFRRLLPRYVNLTTQEKADIIHVYDGSLITYPKPTVFVVNSWKYTCPACIQCTTFDTKICHKGSPVKCSRCYYHNPIYQRPLQAGHSLLGSVHYFRNSFKRTRLRDYHVVSISKTLQDVLQQNGISSTSIYLPVDPEFLGSKPVNTEGNFFYSGNYDWIHGCKLLLESRRYTTLPVQAAGWGVYSNYVQNSDIANLGKVDSPQDMAAHLSESYMFLCLTLHNNYGVSLIEAMASGRPPIAINRGFSKEIIKDGKNGYLIEPDPKILADTMQYAKDNPNDVKRMGRKAHNTVVNEFHPDMVFPQYLNLYKSLT